MELWTIIFLILNICIGFLVGIKNSETMWKETKSFIHDEYLNYWVKLIDKISDTSIFSAESKSKSLKEYILFDLEANYELHKVLDIKNFHKSVLYTIIIIDIFVVILFGLNQILCKIFSEQQILNYIISIFITIVILTILNIVLVSWFIIKDNNIKKIHEKYGDKFSKQ